MVRVSFNLAIVDFASAPVAPKSFSTTPRISGASGFLMTIEKFLPSGHVLAVPLQNFTRSVIGTSLSLLDADVTIAMFLIAARADSAQHAATAAVATTRNSLAEYLACMIRSPFTKNRQSIASAAPRDK